jgi:hypothetical protein
MDYLKLNTLFDTNGSVFFRHLKTLALLSVGLNTFYSFLCHEFMYYFSYWEVWHTERARDAMQTSLKASKGG